jgi:hypothetical protein
MTELVSPLVTSDALNFVYEIEKNSKARKPNVTNATALTISPKIRRLKVFMQPFSLAGNQF